MAKSTTNGTANPFIPGSSTPLPGAGTPNPTPVTPGTPAPGGAPAPAPTMPGASNNDSFEIDLTQAGGVPDGVYKMRCIDIEQSVSSSGNPMFVWSFVIIEGDYQGTNFKYYTAMTPAAMWKVAEAVQALGVGKSGEVVKFKKSDVLNKDCGAVVESQEYKEQKRPSINKLVSLTEYAELKKAAVA